MEDLNSYLRSSFPEVDEDKRDRIATWMLQDADEDAAKDASKALRRVGLEKDDARLLIDLFEATMKTPAKESVPRNFDDFEDAFFKRSQRKPKRKKPESSSKKRFDVQVASTSSVNVNDEARKATFDFEVTRNAVVEFNGGFAANFGRWIESSSVSVPAASNPTFAEEKTFFATENDFNARLQIKEKVANVINTQI